MARPRAAAMVYAAVFKPGVLKLSARSCRRKLEMVSKELGCVAHQLLVEFRIVLMSYNRDYGKSRSICINGLWVFRDNVTVVPH